MLVRDQQVAPRQRNTPLQQRGCPETPTPGGAPRPAPMRSASCGAPSPARCCRWAGTASERSRGKPGRCSGPDGAGGPPCWGSPGARRAELQLCRCIGGGASAVLSFTSKGPACISARPRRKEPRAAVRLSLPMQVQARVTEGKGGERGKETPDPPCPAPLLGIRCPSSSGARRHPGAVGAAAAGKGRSALSGHPACSRGAEGLPPGGGGQAPGVALRHGAAASARRSAAGPGRPAGLRGDCARWGSRWVPAQEAPPGGRGRWGRGARRGPRLRDRGGRDGRCRGALRCARLLPINYRACFPFFLSFFVSFSLPVTFPSLLPDKLNKRWKLCVCVGGAGGKMSLLIIIFLTINASHGTLPPLTMPCGSGAARLHSPLPKGDSPPPPGGYFLAPGGAQPLGVRRGSAGPGRRWPGAAAAP